MCNHLGYLKYSLLLVDSIIQLVKDNCTIACSPHHFFTSYTDLLSKRHNHTFLVGNRQAVRGSEIVLDKKVRQVDAFP